ncbi:MULTISPECIES: glycosyltransferase [unclassified Devosia]|uniref:glycosyltransferase n=1 Tax=unclassified Devosia TaxID=196773 RepID=UPI001556CA63
MRVLHLFKVYLPDSYTGVERVIWQIAEGTAPLGVTTDVLSLSAHPDPNPVRIANHWAHQAKLDLYVRSTGLSFSLLPKFQKLVAKADLVHYHFPWPMMDLMHLLARVRKPSVITYHSDVVRQKNLLRLYRPLMDRFLGSADHIVATSPNYAASSSVLARYRDKLSVIPIGIAEAPAPDLNRIAAMRQHVGEGFFLFVGALRYYKGLPFLLEAARSTGLPVVIAGGGDPSIVARERLGNVTLLGRVDEADKQALLSLCRVFAFPSHLRSEAFGVALLEAAQAGKAMISCEMGTGTSYVNLDKVTGLTVPPGNASALGDAMQRLASDPGLALRMGEAARQRYVELFTAEAMGRSYAALYGQLIAAKASGP